MEQLIRSLKEGLFYLGFVVLAIVLLPLVAVLAIAMRPLLMVSFLAAVLAAVAVSAFSPRFRGWLESAG